MSDHNPVRMDGTIIVGCSCGASVTLMDGYREHVTATLGPHQPVMAEPLLVAGRVCQRCCLAGDDPTAHPPGEATTTDREALAELLGGGTVPVSEPGGQP